MLPDNVSRDAAPQPLPERCRVLVVSDDPEGSRALHAALSVEGVEFTTVGNPDRLIRAWCRGHDLAVVQVIAGRLSAVLHTLRSCRECQGIPVLVDISRLAGDGQLAGLLPTYRAMPCSLEQIVTLARRRMWHRGQPGEPRRLL
jgi:CheY-like chemotaxis protein